MKLKDIMSREVEVVVPGASIREAADKMRALDVGALPVCDGERLVGMITDRDITVRATAEGLNPDETQVGDIMSDEVVFAFEDQDVSEAARIMEDKQIRRLVVLNRDKRLLGIVALADLAVDTGDACLTGEVVEEVSKPG